MKIIPAIDLIDGQLVRLRKGDYNEKTIYKASPLEQAKIFADEGFTHLHLVDLDGAKKGESVHLHVLEQIASKTSLKVDFGGGIKSQNQILNALNAGAHQVNIGSWAVKRPEEVRAAMQRFGADRIILAADVHNEKIVSNAWQSSTDLHILEWIKEWDLFGLKHFFCTDIEKDGMLEGVNFSLYQKLKGAFPHLIVWASGGVTAKEDLTALAETGIEGVITGKAIYEGKLSFQDMMPYR